MSSRNADSLHPNLFAFATSELSQDAFLCWLLSWAKPELRTVDARLHETANLFIRQLLDKHGVGEDLEWQQVEVSAQHKRIDVLVVLNGEIAIPIEDKTNTGAHSGQLERYLKVLSAEEKYQKILPIFFKTGDQCSYEHDEQYGYKTFLRQEFLKVLSYGVELGVTNNIFREYHAYLQRIEDAVNSFSDTPPDDWPWKDPWEAWRGFFLLLQQEIAKAGWGYVPNSGGGFMGFWWHFQQMESSEVYLQLEGDRLCFKIKIALKEGAPGKALRDEWHHRIMESARGSALSVVKPTRFGTGKTMTVGVLQGDYRQRDGAGRLDFPATLSVLRKAEAILDRAVRKESFA